MLINIMTDRKLRLKGRQLKANAIASGEISSVSDIETRTKARYQTIRKWLNAPQTVSEVDLNILADLLVEGLGMKPEQVENLRFGDVFEFVEDEAK